MKPIVFYHKNLILLGGVLGLLAIALGAFGAHALGPQLDTATLNAFETAVRYQMYHALFALIAGILPFLSKKGAFGVFLCILIGVVFFSGSIYGLATAHITGFNYARFALITPLGGLFLMASWLVVILQIWRK